MSCGGAQQERGIFGSLVSLLIDAQELSGDDDGTLLWSSAMDPSTLLQRISGGRPSRGLAAIVCSTLTQLSDVPCVRARIFAVRGEAWHAKMQSGLKSYTDKIIYERRENAEMVLKVAATCCSMDILLGIIGWPMLMATISEGSLIPQNEMT
jgi:hypothetical protein